MTKKTLTKDIYIKILEFGESRPDGFNLNDILTDKKLKLADWEKNIIKKYCKNAHLNTKQYMASGIPNLETLFLVISGGNNYDNEACKYVINLDSRFKYIDYLELKEAIKTAREARWLSMVAIIISIIAVVTSIVVVLIFTQTVKIDQQQYNEIKSLIINKK